MPRPRRPPPHHSAPRSVQGRAGRALRPTQVGTGSASSLLPPPSTPECVFGLRAQLVGGDYEHRVGLGVRHVDHPKIPPGTRLAQRHPGSLSTRTILEWAGQHLTYLVLAHAVTRRVRFSRLSIDVEPHFHDVDASLAMRLTSIRQFRVMPKP